MRRWFVLGLSLFASSAHAENECRVLDVALTPAASGTGADQFPPQIVAWLEDANGQYMGTVFITQKTGALGLGNRPGRFDFNSGPMWPYGRRVTVFPVWSHKHGLEWPEIGFQDGLDDNLSHPQKKSSPELAFCRPLRPDEFDAVTCPSAAYTDKGVLSATRKSLYPPREDLLKTTVDASDVEMFAALNPFDAVSHATPLLGVESTFTYSIPPEVPNGDYVLWVEVSKEFDFNSSYDPTKYPSPPVAYADYGQAYRGQPSVLYRVPVTVGITETTSATDSYAGYGDPDGLDGNVRVPDSTISSGPGTGAGRLALQSTGGVSYRVRTTARREQDFEPPATPANIAIVDVKSTQATLSFTAPGDDGLVGNVRGYEIRYRVGETMTDENFTTGTLAPIEVDLGPPGAEQLLTVKGLVPETTYSIAIRAFDDCRNGSTLAVFELTTTERAQGHVDACFIATAAYGSTMANEIGQLRRFRDSLLAKTVLGELAIETYYTFGPAVAGAIGESDLLRATARDFLGPLVEWVRDYRW
ncbi:MAG TPA: fibronectin type III domain-containing protein [Kofleriaceae bacterium]|nr:fibronectin type III domain-containing protein [Kofleriaceae bacterium]